MSCLSDRLPNARLPPPLSPFSQLSHTSLFHRLPRASLCTTSLKPHPPILSAYTSPTPAASPLYSGPNTGGKTVTLKTLGMAALMARAGLWILCSGEREGVVRVPWFDRVMAGVTTPSFPLPMMACVTTPPCFLLLPPPVMHE